MLESSEESFEGFSVFRSFKANSYYIFGRLWSSRNNVQQVMKNVTKQNNLDLISEKDLFHLGES